MKKIVMLCCLIAASNAFAAGEAMLRGMVEGCVDYQRQLYAEKKMPFEADFVNEFCHCRAANMLDLMRTAELRDKIRNEDPKTVQIIQKINLTCVNGVKAGRKFAPK